MRWVVCALALMFAPAALAAPQRVVSLDYCADQYVLALADRDQIAALSRGSLRDDSYYRSRARGLRQVRASTEEVLALRPDLIVRTWGGAYNARDFYGRVGIAVVELGRASDFVSARAELIEAGAALGQDARAEALASDLDARLARLRARAPGAPVDVMYLSAGGAVAGSGTMMDAVISAAGGRNLRSQAGWAVLPLERMVETPPVLVALGFFDHGRTQMNAWGAQRHEAVQRGLARAHTVSLPLAAISCEAWTAIDAAEAIAQALPS